MTQFSLTCLSIILEMVIYNILFKYSTTHSFKSFTTSSISRGLVSSFQSTDTNTKPVIYMINGDTSTLAWQYQYECRDASNSTVS